MNKMKFQSRVLLVTLVPLMMTGMVLSAYFIWSRISDIDTALNAKGQLLANQLSPATEYGVLSRNRQALSNLLHASLRDGDIKSIIVTDVLNEVVARADALSAAADSGRGGQDRFRSFMAPIYRTSLAIDEFGESLAADGDIDAEDSGPELIGNVQVIISRERAARAQNQILINGLLITLVALLVTAYLAGLLANSVTSPIRHLTRTVSALRDGRLDQRIEVDASGEIADLQQGFNAMASSLQDARAREKQFAEDQLFMEKVRAQTILESLGEGVITTDVNGHITYMNPAAEVLTGWVYAEAKGRELNGIFSVYTLGARKPVNYPVQECLQNKRAINQDYLLTLVRNDGKEFIIQDTVSLLYDNEGQAFGLVLVFHDYSRIHSMSESLAYQATHDHLTGLFNRREFEAQLAIAGHETSDSDTEHALCYIDLDQFKIVNDTCGHQAGDKLLKQVTALIGDKIRKHDIFARLGGDEFGIILRDCPLDHAEQLANHIREAVSNFRFAWEQHVFEIGASIGLVPIRRGGVETAELLMTADSACYIAKDKGRNRVHTYQPTDEDILQRSGDMQWLQRLNQNLEANRFVLFCQLIAPVRQGRKLFFGYEILIRLDDAEQGLILPGNFIPSAERYQLMLPIDKWVVENAFRMLAQAGFRKLTDDTSPLAVFSINLSSQSLADEDFHDFVLAQFEQSGLDPAVINFEITETAAISNMSRAIQFMESLKQLGCKFLLDDFGSGLSSFAYLNNLPIDYIKVDGHFVHAITHNPVSRSIVESIARIGEVMGVKTIAEFVDSEEILQEARLCGIDYVQGFSIERPRPLREALRLIDLARDDASAPQLTSLALRRLQDRSS